MISSSVLAARDILSESNLSNAIISQLGSCRELEQANEAVILDAQEVAKILASWKASIDRQSTRLVKYVTSNLSDLPGGCLYNRLDEPLWRRAARICEVFRNPDVSKNAGRLDTHKLQGNILACLEREAPFTLALGWGQPKRAAGGLKTLGHYADLAEMYAIARLAIIVRAVTRLAERPIQLTILTGGSRFFEAFFTRPELTVTYDEQRQQIADALCGPGIINFHPYSALVGDGSSSAVVDERVGRFEAALATVDDSITTAKFGAILLNIDWDHVFAQDPRARYQRPHGIDMPRSLQEWLLGANADDRNRLIRAAIVGLITPKHQSAWLETFENEEVLEDALSFVQAVAWESTRKYIALHLMDADDEASTVLIAQGVNALRLTVHEKRDHREMPALFTLGQKGGNLLSQHVMAVVNRNEIIFESFAELRSRDVVRVCIEDAEIGNGDQNSLFQWLGDARQPLCFIERATGDAASLIARAGEMG